MKKYPLLAAVAVIGFLTLFDVHPCPAQTDHREFIGEYGYIDWLAQKVYATGVGIIPQNKTHDIQASAMAQRAALVVAQRNLLGVIKGVHIDSRTVVENRMARDDVIVAKIEGVVRLSRVEETRTIDNRAVEVLVSMPISGKLGEILISTPQETEGGGGIRQPQEMALRLKNLENRVQMLEERISNLKQISVQKEDLLFLFQRLNAAWQAYAARQAPLSRVGYASDAETAALRNELIDQEKRLASLSVLLQDISRRLSTLENNMVPEKTVPPAPAPTHSSPYTGLIVDARRTGFKPCLKPGLFINGEPIYPGNFLNTPKVVKEGYVRYYSDPQQAQQSERVGSLPYVVQAVSTFDGERGLALSGDAYAVLKAVLQSPDNFLAQARVIIVF